MSLRQRIELTGVVLSVDCRLRGIAVTSRRVSLGLRPCRVSVFVTRAVDDGRQEAAAVAR